MKNRITRFLTMSLVLVSMVCVGIFSFLAFYMNKRNTETIDTVGAIYMSGINEQKAKHFGTIIDLQLSPVEDLVRAIPAQDTDEEALRNDLIFRAQERGFESLAFCFDDGTLDMIYGEPAASLYPAPFLESLENGEKKVSAGQDAAGNRIVLMGVPLGSHVAGKPGRVALVATLPIDYIDETLALSDKDAVIYSFVIRTDGSFVIRSFGQFRDSYFERIRANYEEIDGKQAERYVEELQTAMVAGEDYSTVVQIEGDRRNLYCSSLPHSEWYLVTVMPYGAINEVVEGLSSQWLHMALGGCAVILLVLLLVFLKYFQLNRDQMQAIEEEKRKAECASKSKSEFLSNMSHDIRTPMNAIVGMTAIASANIDNTQQVQNCLKKITLSSQHLLGLINDILDMSKIESGKMTLNLEPISLREVMDNIVNIVQPQVKAKKQQFDVFIHDISTEEVCSDSVRLNQVMLNLLSNAIKFTPEGGSIQVSLYEEDSPQGEDFIRIHLEVRDTGIGMSEEFQEKIFESFMREDSARVHKTEGSGLGMAITKYIVDAMGGTIEIHSQKGVGTTFHVTIDFQRVSEREQEMILPEWNMLVVDDDQQLCESVVSALQATGVQAEWTLDGESAVKLVAVRHEAHQDYQIILLDWKLPGMDGLETAREIRRELDEDIPILLISAYDWSEIEEEAKAAGINGFISKPLFKSTLFYGLKPYAERSVSAKPAEEHAADFTGRRILLAEDNELNWEIAAELLKELGLELEWAENGRICVEKFQQSPVGFYDAILMDIRMPEMTGYQAADAIRKLDRPDADIPIIAMTADAFLEDVQCCLEHGMNAHIAKPIDIKAVSRLLEKYLCT